MATRDELEKGRQALHEAAARLVALAEQGVDERPSQQDLEHARAYAETAAMMRRRAGRLAAQGDEEHAAYELGRAEHFEARAAAKRAGDPMPRALRTPAESLVRVDEFRRSLANLLATFADVDAKEWAAFVEALAPPDGPVSEVRHPSRDEGLESMERVLAALGVEGTGERAFRPYSSPLDPLGRSD